jgi:hypothetical protein
LCKDSVELAKRSQKLFCSPAVDLPGQHEAPLDHRAGCRISRAKKTDDDKNLLISPTRLAPLYFFHYFSGVADLATIMVARLRRAQTFLRTLGIEITFSREGRTGTRMIRVSTSAEDTVSTVSIVSAGRSASRGDRANFSGVRE